MNFIEFIGYAAAFLTTFSFFPQAIKTIKTRDTSGISLFMYCAFTMGVFAWLVYALFIENMPMIVANLVTLIPASIVLVLKIKGMKTAQS